MTILNRMAAGVALGLPMAMGAIGCSSQKVYTVDRVEVIRSGRIPQAVVITADGTTRTDGWSDFRLLPAGYNYTTGEYKLTFVGKSPSGVGKTVTTPATATYIMSDAPSGMKSVTVKAETSKIQQSTFTIAASSPKAPAEEPKVSDEPAISEEPAAGVVGPKPQFEPKPEAEVKPEPKPEPEPAAESDLEDALEK